MKKSIKFQISFALATQFIVLLLIVSFTVYALNLRKHDYAILNLAGQLRVLSQTIVAQSYNYVERAPRDYGSYRRDLGLYNRDLQSFITAYDRIINSFKARQLGPDLWGASALINPASQDRKIPSLLDPEETIKCTWDKQSRNQLDVTASIWQRFKGELQNELGNDRQAPRLEAAAKYIIFHETELLETATDLSSAFRAMMEEKLNNINLWNRVAILVSLLIASTLVYLLYRKTFKPLDSTVKAFRKIAQGDLSQQVPVSGGTEISSLILAFNAMTQRLSSLFHLTDRINQATNLDDTLKFVCEEFRAMLPIDWVGMLHIAPGEQHVVLERQYGDKQTSFHENDSFLLMNSPFHVVQESGKPLVINDVRQPESIFSKNSLVTALDENGLGSAIFFPLGKQGEEQAVLVFAARQKEQYAEEHIELLENIAAQVGHAFNKTIGMESLVISAVEGLAKLAENRDPETGDHLVRMSLYSAIIAEQLGEAGQYSDKVSASYIRDVFRFAPMHDIGKVGVPDSILLKPGKLDAHERKQMEIHPVIGAEVLKRCEQQVQRAGHSIFRVGIEIAEAHHEKFDGSGYPYQLSGTEIPLSARIVAVADVFDALTSRRPYKQAWSIDKALALVEEQAGQHFDPVVVEAMQAAMPRILEVYNKHKHV
jgi:response regulator RpfG family c-di-GMP phosphodiesterase/HAMP domain-containing protein